MTPFRPFLTRLMLLLCIAQPAMAELMLNPTRVVIGKNQRAAQVELINSGSEAATYRIGLVNRRMTETGEFLAVTEAAPGELFADSMLNYSPRQITLQPGTAQVVRIMVRKPDGLAPGEYRSHLHFEKLPPAGSQTSAGEQQIGVVLTTLVGASIPVIVRHETGGAQAALSALALTGGAAPQLAFQIERRGDTSIYGDLTVTWSAPGMADIIVGRANGVAVYTPNPLRRASIELTPPPGKALRQGSLQLVLRERADAGAAVMAQAALALP